MTNLQGSGESSMVTTFLGLDSTTVQGLTLIAAIVVAIIYFLQWWAMRDTIKAQNLAGLIMYLQSPEVRKARHFVFNDLKRKEYVAWNNTDKEMASTACAAYGVAGALIDIGRVDPAPIIKNWGPSIRSMYDICRAFIEEQQREIGADYWRSFIALYNRVPAKPLSSPPRSTLAAQPDAMIYKTEHHSGLEMQAREQRRLQRMKKAGIVFLVIGGAVLLYRVSRDLQASDKPDLPVAQ